MKRLIFFLLLLAIFFAPFFSNLIQVKAEEKNSETRENISTEHLTLIINQVRGSECCDAGKIDNFKFQLETASKLDLPSNFALRYDTLLDEHYQNLIKKYANSSLINYGGFLEITPQLATDAGVAYTGDEKNWYQAAHAYLVGYSVADRQKIIDTYMSAFAKVIEKTPDFTTAWMIDPVSLQYLHEKYQVNIHQITREQYGTDSYTLDGGPTHYPYFPSQNWALVPDNYQEKSKNDLPLIVRQTITDPIYNYGDISSGFTSQPNDYFLREANLDYFIFLFEQAHHQNTQEQTFALVGLENSMSTEIQTEFEKQLQYISQWQKGSLSSTDGGVKEMKVKEMKVKD